MSTFIRMSTTNLAQQILNEAEEKMKDIERVLNKINNVTSDVIEQEVLKK